MKQEEFIEAIKLVVADSSIKTTIKTLESPPGRQPQQKILQLSEWFNNLSDEDKSMVKDVIEKSVKASVFGFLCVLDGVRQIENTSDKGALKLYFEKKGVVIPLNDPKQEYLHDLYNSI